MAHLHRFAVDNYFTATLPYGLVSADPPILPEKVLSRRTDLREGETVDQVLIKWDGLEEDEATWMDVADACFNVLKQEAAANNPHLIIDVADSLMSVGHPESALTYYLMLEEDSEKYNGYLHLKIARCCVSLNQRGQAIEYYKKPIRKLDDSVDARMTLLSMLLEEGRDDEAISVLSPPVESGLIEVFVDVLFPVIHETLLVEQNQRKARSRPRLTGSVLSERTEVLKDSNSDRVLLRLPPLASSAALAKAARAKKELQKKAALEEAKRAEALAAGCDYNSDDSDDESQEVSMESPLPGFLNEERNHLLISITRNGNDGDWIQVIADL
ncbi:hypothetical protein SASPL_137974 [Salvia splendens]|uniref:Chromo domain-containing protein n=1 Tax=Salvia splendens TaxID=180675 RepID=A0A8X8ZEJ4_SALSN|nr:hypothetical protein SASPL_137974 [Salvia splendens]